MNEISRLCGGCYDTKTIRLVMYGESKGVINLDQFVNSGFYMTLDTYAFYSTDYVINASNRQFTLRQGSTDYTIILDLGNISASSLSAAIQTKIDATAISGVTVSRDLYTGKLQFVSSGGNIQLRGMNVYTQRLLGFETDVSVIGTTIISSSIPVVSNSTVYNVFVDGGDLVGYDPDSAAFKIISQTEAGGMVMPVREFDSGVYKITQRGKSTLDVRIHDETGNLLKFGSYYGILIFKLYLPRNI